MDVNAKFARIPKICQRYGFSRATLYRLAGEGKIRLVRLGGGSFVDVASVEALFEALPQANIKPTCIIRIERPPDWMRQPGGRRSLLH